MKNIYIILMYTGSIPSKFVSIFTLYKYSHVAISLDKTVIHYTVLEEEM